MPTPKDKSQPFAHMILVRTMLFCHQQLTDKTLDHCAVFLRTPPVPPHPHPAKPVLPKADCLTATLPITFFALLSAFASETSFFVDEYGFPVEP